MACSPTTGKWKTGTKAVRRGFSLLELLLVGAIVVGLVGLLLGAVQSVRESSRRLSCAHKLRQLGVGLMLHHDARGFFPPSMGGSDSFSTHTWGTPPEWKPFPRPGFGAASAYVFLLPYIGEDSLHTAIEAAGRPVFFSDIYMSARLPSLLCPSDVAPRSHNYLFSIGDRFTGFWPPGLIPPAKDAEFQAGLRGLFGLQSRVRIASIEDGLSQTIAMSEGVRPTGLGIVPAGRAVAGVTYTGVDGEAVTNDRFAVAWSGSESPSACLASFVGGRFREGSILLVTNRSPGHHWNYGRPSFVGFATVLPPNGPRCNHFIVQGSLTPQSRHPGGVMALMADGAVRFVTDDIDSGDPAAVDHTTGPSPYGIWGAMGSRSGHEATPLLP